MTNLAMRSKRRFLAGLATLAIGTAAVSEVEATAIFTADASATLALISPASPSLLLFPFAEVSEDFIFPIGSASGDTDGSAEVVDSSLVQSAHAEGQASGDGFVDVFVLTDGSLFFENTGSSDLDLVFQLDYSVSAAANVDNPLFEDALGQAVVEIFGAGAFAAPGDLETSLFLFEVFGDALFGPPFDDDADSITFSLTLPAASSGDLVMFVDAAGFADSFVPEPATSSLVALALLTFAAVRRRR